MSQTFIKTPFAISGDVVTIPDTVQSDGTVSFPQGFGPDYQADPSNPAVLYPERRVINEILLLLSANIQVLQTHGFPDYIPSAQNGGVAYPYDQNSCVRYSDGVVYYSLVGTNTALPTDATKWTPLFPVSAFQTGMTIIHEDTNLPSGGWVWANGQTIGDASSGATGRANADTLALFTQIWTAFPQSVRPLQNSSGTIVARGTNAAADYAANRRIPLRDMRGNVPAGWTTMGGATDSANLLPVNALGVDGSVFGASGGEGLGHEPTLAEMFQHAHGTSALSVIIGNHQHYVASNAPSQAASTVLADNASAISVYGAPNDPFSGSGGASYVLKKQTTGAGAGTPANIGLSSPQINAAASSISGSTDSNGGGDAFNVVQPTTICNFITKL